jgi:hypothetical protein
VSSSSVEVQVKENSQGRVGATALRRTDVRRGVLLKSGPDNTLLNKINYTLQNIDIINIYLAPRDGFEINRKSPRIYGVF